MKRPIVFILAITAWAYPIHAASALEAEPETKIEFTNYKEIRDKQRVSPALQSNPKRSMQNNIRPPSGRNYSGEVFSKEEVIQLIIDYSATYRIESATPLCIAKHESGYNQFSKNKTSTASGVFQYLSSTWSQTDEGKAGYSVFDAEQNVKAAVKYMAIHKRTTPWVVAPKCPTLVFL